MIQPLSEQMVANAATIAEKHLPRDCKFVLLAWTPIPGSKDIALHTSTNASMEETAFECEMLLKSIREFLKERSQN